MDNLLAGLALGGLALGLVFAARLARRNWASLKRTWAEHKKLKGEVD